MCKKISDDVFFPDDLNILTSPALFNVKIRFRSETPQPPSHLSYLWQLQHVVLVQITPGQFKVNIPLIQVFNNNFVSWFYFWFCHVEHVTYVLSCWCLIYVTVVYEFRRCLKYHPIGLNLVRYKKCQRICWTTETDHKLSYQTVSSEAWTAFSLSKWSLHTSSSQTYSIFHVECVLRNDEM